MNTRYTRWIAALLLTSVMGCSQHTAYDPQVDHQTLESSEFVHFLTKQPVATFDQACRAMLLVSDGEESPRSFEERVTELQSRGVIRAEWNLKSNHVVDRGTIAYMIHRACKMPGGLNTWLSTFSGFGDCRYALKEVVRQGVMPYGLPYQTPTGGEVMDAFAKADDYMARQGMYQSTETEISSPEDLQQTGGG